MSTVLQLATAGLPITFLNATVLAFNGSIGYGSQQESTLSIDLIEDCESITPEGCINEQYINTSGLIGSPQYFTAGDFTFGGIVTSWTKSQSTSGKIYSIKMVDPRQLLENVTLVTDTLRSPSEPYREGPSSTFWSRVALLGINYFNVYEYWEGGLCISDETGEITVDKCCTFGRSQTNSQGMPYSRILWGFSSMKELDKGQQNPTIYSIPESGVQYSFEVDASTFPLNLPSYYRIPGPSITLLQLLQDACDVGGYDFYVYMEKMQADDPTKPDRNVIKVGLVDLKTAPTSFSNIIDSFDGKATSISFGEELRNDITRSLIIGENVHKLSYEKDFLPYFGQDKDAKTSKLRPVVPFYLDTNGFWIAKNVNDLNIKLYSPFFEDNALYSIHELDIRCAMASFKAWLLRTMSNNTPGTFNNAIRNQFSECIINNPTWIKERLSNPEQLGILQDSLRKNLQDLYQNPTPQTSASNRPDLVKDLEIIHQWLADLGATYYGKQYLISLSDRTCVKQINYANVINDLSSTLLLDPLEPLYPPPTTDINQAAEVIYTVEPTNAGGWVEPDENGNITVLDLADPELQLFRTDDGRIRCFAVFKTDGEVANAGVQ